MAPSLHRAFQASLLAMAAAISGCASIGAAFRDAANSNVDINAIVKDPMCISLKAVLNPRKPVEYYVAAQYRRTSTTRIGQMLLDPRDEDPIIVCFDPKLNKENKCGFYDIGESDDDSVSLNPAKRVADIDRELTLIHETRHIFQKKMNIDFTNSGNVPESQRVVLYWMMEADARLATIVYAYEKSRQGHPEYMDSLRDDNGHDQMVKAFEVSLRVNPRDMQGAMRSAFAAFLIMDDYKSNYANETADWIESAKEEFNPDLPIKAIYKPADLIAMGNMGSHGNYMTSTLADLYTKSFASTEFAQFQQKRRDQAAPTCSL